MQRHRFDPLSFAFGLLFVAVAGIALIGVDLIELDDLAWIAPAVLVAAGAALLLGSAGRRPSQATEGVGPENASGGRVGPSDDAPNVVREEHSREHADERVRGTDTPSTGEGPADR